MISNLDSGYQAYKLYVALKNHFTSQYYDFFKYGGNVKAGRSSFERRNDKFFFCKLAKKKDVKGFLIANLIDNQTNWIGDVVTSNNSEKVYTKWLARQQSLQYIFENDLAKLDANFNSNIIVENGQHPKLLKLALRKEISLETVVIMNSLCKFFKYWSRNIEDQLVWPTFKFKCVRYRPFVEFDEEKFRKIVVDKFSDLD